MRIESGEMDAPTFERFRNLIYERSGITLGEGKRALLVSRLGGRMRELGIPTHREYLDYVLRDSGDEVVRLLDAISTNVTSFYREPTHVTFLERDFRARLERGARRYRVWSAASSSGEEPYTIAMTLYESMTAPPPDVKILATDISTRVLARCREGVYESEKLKTVPDDLRRRHFAPVANSTDAACRVKDHLRQMIRFARLNLATPPFPMSGPFDVIFCRNVMIYFDPQIKKNLVTDMHRLLRPDGFLIIGHAESLNGLDVPYRLVEPAVYARA
ncbi:MAG: protein-glutamate O-methyltransferase CheR [Candidatus Eisenbacteria bacterium]